MPSLQDKTVSPRPGPNINRKGFGLKQEVRGALDRDYGSGLIGYFLQQEYELRLGNLTLLLAQEFGFCYGVERAIDYAYQTRRRFPDRRIFLIGPIVHNRFVNRQLEEMGITILDGFQQDDMDFSFLQPEDVVVFPAFGVKQHTVERLKKTGCVLVDTTCGSVISVWKRVEKYAREGYTTLIHGKYHHEETQATCSHVGKYPGAKFLVVLNREETQLVCDVIRGAQPAKVLLERLGPHASPGFNPETDLQKIGVANQTTMLSSESLEIARMLREALRKRYGERELSKRFLSFDTICSATQDRQDAVVALVTRKKPDLMLVIGGFQSSNTGHLAEIAGRLVPTYHIEDAGCLISRREIRFREPLTGRLRSAKDWLPGGPVRIGLTAGASTPNVKIAEVVWRLAELSGQQEVLHRLLEDR